MKSKNLLWFMVLAAIMIFMAPDAAYSGAIELPKTGQTTSYYAGDDGDVQEPSGDDIGVAWPDPRFNDNSDGTITDQLTGLVWLKNADCYGQTDWKVAIESIFILANGDCGLSDGSSAGDWRMPNLHELDSLLNYGESNMVAWLGSQGFSNVQDYNYWVSTLYASSAQSAWSIRMIDGRYMLYEGGQWGGGKSTVGARYIGGPPDLNKQFPHAWPVRGTAEGAGTVSLPETGDINCAYSTGPGVWAPDPTCNPANWAEIELQDGYLRPGVAWPTTGTSPSGRFSDNLNQTMTDHLTGIIWTKSGNVLSGGSDATETITTFTGALDYIADMNNGTDLSGLCGTPCENFGYTDWRLPNVREMRSLINYKYEFNQHDLYLAPEGFVKISTITGENDCWNVGRAYWTSTSAPIDPVNQVYTVPFCYSAGDVWYYPKTSTGDWWPWSSGHHAWYIWPVRDAGNSPFWLTAGISPQGKGSITGTGINCPTDCSESYDVATPDVVLTAYPYVGSIFDSWTGCDSAVDNVCTMNMDETKGVTANFEVPDIAVDPMTVPFGNVNVGLDVERDITVTNNDVVAFPLGTITIAGDTQFSIVAEDCSGKNLEASGGDDSCSITVGFSPTATGLFNGTIDIPPLAVVALTGTGSAATGPDISVTSNALDFTSTPVSTAPVQTVTVTNDGTDVLEFGAITGPASPFSISGNTCPVSPTTLAVGANCDINVTYTAPGAPQGPDISSFDIASDDPDEDPVTISLMGSAIGGGNNPPEKPILLSPVNGATTALPASFAWEDAIDPDGDSLTHTLYLATDPAFQNLIMPVAALDSSDVSYAMVLGNPVFMIALFGLAAFGVFLRRKKIALIIIAVMFTGLLLASCANHKDVAGGGDGGGTGGGVLQAGTTYYWKVIADDGNGGVTPSDVWSFTTAP